MSGLCAARHADFAPLDPETATEHEYPFSVQGAARFVLSSVTIKWVSGLRTEFRAVSGEMLRVREACAHAARESAPVGHRKHGDEGASLLDQARAGVVSYHL